jgi:hypothetical protein
MFQIVSPYSLEGGYQDVREACCLRFSPKGEGSIYLQNVINPY